MENETKLLSGAMVALALATGTLVVIPYMQLMEVPPAPGLKPYSSAELRGRQEYIKQGCVYCHSQQPRDAALAPDFKRGWGRASVAADYFYDKPHLLGTMRTGPDLFNIGARQPSIDWHLGHLYQPRAYQPESIMPAYPFLFEFKDKAAPDDKVIALPPSYAPRDGVVVARPEAMDLAKYLLALNHTYRAPGALPLPAPTAAVAPGASASSP
jgi:cytochrome c oxidase cbb3-type subunit II